MSVYGIIKQLSVCFNVFDYAFIIFTVISTCFVKRFPPLMKQCSAVLMSLSHQRASFRFSAAHHLFCSIHAFSYIVSLSKCMHVLLFGMSCMFMFKMIAAWSEKRNTISVCAACVNIIHHVLHPPFCMNLSGFFLCENVPQWCVANLCGLSVLDAYQKGSSHKTAHLSLTAQLTPSECHETLLILFTQTICYQSTMSLVKQGFCMCAT